MQLTKQQIEALKGKCPECKGDGNTNIHRQHNKFNEIDECEPSVCDCPYCQGTGQAVIEIEKEWVECEYCLKGIQHTNLELSKCNGEIPKYKFNEEIYYCLVCNKELNKYHKRNSGDAIKLKIISETETTHTLVMSPR